MTETLTKEEQIQFSKEIENLKEATNSSLEFYKRNLVLFNGRTIKNFTHYFLDLLSRFRLNIEAVEKLMDSFYDDFRLKISINLLLRSICADSLTALYLITFIDESDPTNTSLKNELDIISSEFLRFGNKFIDEEHHLHETYAIQILKSLEEKKDYLRKISPELFNDNGSIKSRDEIRLTTSEDIKKGLKNSGHFLSEEEKNHRIKEKYSGKYGMIFIAFKYYSQFQHFTLMSKEFINAKPFLDTFYMHCTLDHMLITTDLILQMAESPNPNFRDELAYIRKKMESTLKSI